MAKTFSYKFINFNVSDEPESKFAIEEVKLIYVVTDEMEKDDAHKIYVAIDYFTKIMREKWNKPDFYALNVKEQY